MSSNKLITVIGATGLQGGSVVRALLSSTQGFSIRGVTRDTSKPAAKALQEKGVDVVAADMNDKDSLVKAFQGSYGVFAVTNYWEKMDGKVEEQQGRNMVDAAKEAGVQHFVFSALDDIAKVSNGKFPNVYHFDSKARVQTYAESQLPSTAFMPGFYMSNLPSMHFIRPNGDGTWTFAFPGSTTAAKFPLFDVENDTGVFVRAIFENREKSLGQRVLAATDYYSAQQIADEFKKTFPKDVKDVSINSIPDDAFKGILGGMGMPDFAQQEMLENFLVLGDVGYYGGESLDNSHKLLGKEKPTTWIEFMKKADAYKGMS